MPFYVEYVAKAVTDIDATVSKVTGAGHKNCGCHRCVLAGGCLACESCPLKQKKVEPEPEKDQTAEDLAELTNFVTEMLQSK